MERMMLSAITAHVIEKSITYIGFVFVDEKYRGNRLSQQLIEHAIDYIKNIGYDRAYIVCDHENLYEKYGFHIIDRKITPWGSEEKIYMREF